MKFEISDWVQVRTDNGELIHGFIETINQVQGITRIFVVKSDNEQSVGKPVVVRDNVMKKLPEMSFDTADDLESLIDIALLTWDEQWFDELTGKLVLVQKNEDKKVYNSTAYPSYTNRLSFPV
jgi:NACalpha-BTF3-like transcription factor